MIKNTVKKNQERKDQPYTHKTNFEYQIEVKDKEHGIRITRIPDRVSPD